MSLLAMQNLEPTPRRCNTVIDTFLPFVRICVIPLHKIAAESKGHKMVELAVDMMPDPSRPQRNMGAGAHFFGGLIDGVNGAPS